jgi:hypothetical protein
MLDHVFTDAIAALRDVLENALLEPQLVEERLHADILAGDLTWQTTYSLPGEGNPPRVQADLTLEWSTWSQSAYRSWRLGEAPPEPPRMGVEVVLRVQRLRHAPDPQTMLAVLPAPQVTVGPIQLERNGPRLETSWDGSATDAEHAIEVGYEASFELDEATLTDAGKLDGHFAAMGGWIASTLVRLADLDFDFLPPDEEGSEP